MKSFNRIQLIGYLGADPKFITLKNGNAMARFRMATDTYFPQQEGAPRKFTEWHTVKVWSPQQVEQLRNYLIKGSHILVDGRITYRHFTDKEGKNCITAEIQANYLVDLDR